VHWDFAQSTGGPVGAASALKMAYAGLNKGLTALAAAMAPAATRTGAAKALREELAYSQPQLLAHIGRSLPDMYPKAHRWNFRCEKWRRSRVKSHLPRRSSQASQMSTCSLQRVRKASARGLDALMRDDSMRIHEASPAHGGQVLSLLCTVDQFPASQDRVQCNIDVIVRLTNLHLLDETFRCQAVQILGCCQT